MANLSFVVRWADNTAELKQHLKEGLDQIEATRSAVDKIAQSLGGDKLLRAANNYAAALQKIGGEAGALGAIEKQSAVERQRGIDLLTKAIDKYAQLGRTAPSALREILTASQAAQRPMSLLADQAKRVQEQIDRFSGDQIIQEAHAIARAIEQIGGASQLTAKEQAIANAAIQEALKKYQALGHEAPAQLQKVGDALNKIQPPKGGFFGDLTGEIGRIAAGFVSAQAVISGVQTAFRALTNFIKDSIKEFAAAEAAQSKLTAALRQQSLATPAVIQQYQALGKEFQRTTVYSDDLIAEMEALLVQVGGVMPSKMREALKAATDLASGLGIDLQQATTLVAKAAAGHTETLGRYGITVSDAALKTRGFDAVLESINRQFGGQAAAQIETYAGRVQQAANAWADFKENVGKAILTNALIDQGIRKAGDAVKELGGDVGDTNRTFSTFVQIAGSFVPLLGTVARRMEDSADAANTLAVAMGRLATMPSPFEAWQKAGALPDLNTRGLAEFDALNKRLEEQAKKSAQAAKDYAEALQQLNESLSGRGLLAEAKKFEIVLQQIGGATKLTRPEIDRYTALLDDVIEKYRVLGRADIVKHFEALRTSLAPLNAETAKLLTTIEHGIEGMAGAFDGLDVTPVREATLDIGTLSESVEQLQRQGLFASAAIKQMGIQIGTLPNVTPAAKQALDEARRSAEGFGTALRRSLADFPLLVAKAFTGGGGISGAFNALFSRIGADLFGENGPLGRLFSEANGAKLGSFLGKGIGKALGDTLGSLLPGIGTAIGSLLGPILSKIGGALKNLFGGPSQKELDGRKVVREFEQTVSSLISTMGKAEANGQKWAEVVIAVREAYLSTGRTAADAESVVRRLWEAEREGPEAVQAILNEINPALEEHRAQLQKTGREIEALLGTASGFADSLPERFRPALEEVARLGLISRDALDDLFDPQSVDIEELQRIAQEYGVALESLGPRFQNARISERAQQILEDFNLLIESGGDFGGVLTDFGDEIGALVQDALKFGTALPENFRPLVEQLLSAGKLLDENGQKITNINGLTFGDPIKVGLDAIVSRLDALLQGLGIQLPAALGAAGEAAGNFGQEAGDQIRNNFGGAIRDIGAQVPGLVQKFRDALPSGVEAGADDMSRSIEDFIKQLERDLGGATEGTEDEVDRTTSLLGEMFGALPDFARDAARRISDELARIRIPRIEIPVEYVPGDLPGEEPTNPGDFSTGAFTASRIVRADETADARSATETEQPIVVNLLLDGQIVASTTVKHIARGKRGLDTEMKLALGLA